MMTAFMAAPVLVKLLASLALILAGNALLRRFLPWSLTVTLGLATLIGTVVLAVWLGLPWVSTAATAGIGRVAVDRLVDPDNLLLGVAILLVIWLSGLMAETGAMRELVGTVRGRLGRRTAMGALPAIIGWLPMPGGALFSAPLVDDCDAESEVEPLLKTRINYWFRHVWEYWWPLYPGVLLCIDITGLEVWSFLVLMLPLSVASIVTGWACLLRRVPPEGGAPPATGSGSLGRFLGLIAPILVVIITYAAIKVGLAVINVGRAEAAVVGVNKYLPMIAGLALAVAWIALRHRPAAVAWRKVVLNHKTFMLLGLVFAIRIFGAVIEADLPDGEQVLDLMNAELAAWHIPFLAIIVIIPFIAGLATGLAIGFVGAGFPVVVGLLGDDPSRPELWACIALAFGWGYVGMLLSPVHVCLVVTNRHFETSLQRSLWRLLPAAAMMLTLVSLYSLGLWLLVPG